MIDSSMYQDFAAEAKGYLAELESALLKLKDGYDTPGNKIETAGILHNLQESSGFTGLEKTARLAREMANLLELVRQSGIALNEKIMAPLFDGKEKLALLVEDLRNFGEERTEIQDSLARIRECIDTLKRKAEKEESNEDGAPDDLESLFDTLDEEEDVFEETPEILAALSEDDDEPLKQQQISADLQSPAPRNEPVRFVPSLGQQTLESSQKASFHQAEKPLRSHVKKEITTVSLQEEIQSTQQEEELFDIFIKQLAENISLLSIMKESLAEVSDKSQVLGKCSDILSRLHSSANYMGYDRLTDFYGQWIAELEMTDMELSMGSKVQFDFMDKNIRIVTDLFPQLDEIDKKETPEEEPSEETNLPEENFPSAEEKEKQPEIPAAAENIPAKIQEDGDEDFDALFSTFDDISDEDFEEDEIIAALSDEEPPEPPTDEDPPSPENQSPIPELDDKLRHFFDEPEEELPPPAREPAQPVAADKPEDHKATGEKKTRRHQRLITDTTSLKEEIESEEYDDELFQIFIEQLQENISQLRTMTDNFSEAPGKTELIKRCSDLLTALHSSANYMGYERLTDFYGQWIAELEMADLQLSIGGPVSFDFMDTDINTIVEIFPQIKDVPADIELPQPPSTESTQEPPHDDVMSDGGIEPIASLSDSGSEIQEEKSDSTPPDDQYDQIRALFSDEDDKIEEDVEFDDIFTEEPEQPVETDPRRKELFERLSGALESLSGESASKSEEHDIEEITTLLHDEIAQKEVGQERFEQYIRLVNQDIGKLRSLNNETKNAADRQHALRQYAEVLERHESAAQAMNYKGLENFYSRWRKDITLSLEALADYEPVDLHYLPKNIDILFKVFGDYLTISDEHPAPMEDAAEPFEAVRQDEQPSPGQESDTSSPSADDQQLFDRLSRALDAEGEISTPGESIASFDTDVDLFARLSNALDEKGFEHRTAGMKSIDDVVNEILSGEGVPGPQTPAPKIHDAIPAPLTDGSPEPAGPANDEADRQEKKSIRVDADKIAQLMDRVEELNVSRSSISELYNEIDHVQEDLSNAGFQPETLRPLNDYADKLSQANEVLSRIAGEISEGLLSVRMVPAGSLFRQYPVHVGDMVREAGKKIKFTIDGEETKLDQTIIEEISGPLQHILRHSIEHGIESPEERKKEGKDETALLRLEAYPESNAVVIEVSDDGKGIDPLAVKNKALEQQIVTEKQIDSMSEPEIIRLVMEPGFTSIPDKADGKDQAASLDNVRQTIETLKGSIDIRSEVGKGTLFRIKIPLLLSILQAVGVEVGTRVLTVPLANVVETARVRWEEINESEGVELIMHRDTSLPVFRLSDILKIEPGTAETRYAYILVVQAKGQRAGFVVDGFRRPRETVVKPLAEYLRNASGFSGATILDDGSISLVLDTATIFEIIQNRMAGTSRQIRLENALQGLPVA